MTKALGGAPPCLLQCSVNGVLRSLILLCRRPGEEYARGVVYNDLKVDNITVLGGVHWPILHLIDLGWVRRVGRVAGGFTLEMSEVGAPREGFAAECNWMAPEVREQWPVFASRDVSILHPSWCRNSLRSASSPG